MWETTRTITPATYWGLDQGFFLGLWYDEIRVYGSGTQEQGAFYAVADDIYIENVSLGTRYCVSTPTSLGSPAYLYALGSSSITANDLELEATPVPGSFGVVYYGPEQLQLPFGDGFRCVGGVVGRSQLIPAVNQALRLQFDTRNPVSAATMITPGSTWNLQAWFRDPAAAGAGFNLSDGLQVLFVP